MATRQKLSKVSNMKKYLNTQRGMKLLECHVFEACSSAANVCASSVMAFFDIVTNSVFFKRLRLLRLCLNRWSAKRFRTDLINSDLGH